MTQNSDQCINDFSHRIMKEMQLLMGERYPLGINCLEIENLSYLLERRCFLTLKGGETPMAYCQDRREGGSRGNCPGARAPPGARRKRSFALPSYVAMISSSWAPQGARKIELSLLVQLSFISENSTTYKNHLNQ